VRHDVADDVLTVSRIVEDRRSDVER